MLNKDLSRFIFDSYIVFLEYAKIEQSKKGSAEMVVLYITELVNVLLHQRKNLKLPLTSPGLMQLRKGF